MPAGPAKPVQEIMVVKGAKVEAREDAVEVVMSRARKEMSRLRSWEWRLDCEGEGEERVVGRRASVIVGREEGGRVWECWARERRMGRPSSPAPRTRIF